jgi:hypothetical protein
VVQEFVQYTFLDLLCLKRMHSCCTDSNTPYFNFNIVILYNSIMYISLGLSVSQCLFKYFCSCWSKTLQLSNKWAVDQFLLHRTNYKTVFSQHIC